MLHRRKAEKQRTTMTHLLGNTCHHLASSSTLSKPRFFFFWTTTSSSYLGDSDKFFSDFTFTHTLLPPATRWLRRERRCSEGGGVAWRRWFRRQSGMGAEHGVVEGGEKQEIMALPLIVASAFFFFFFFFFFVRCYLLQYNNNKYCWYFKEQDQDFYQHRLLFWHVETAYRTWPLCSWVTNDNHGVLLVPYSNV